MSHEPLVRTAHYQITEADLIAAFRYRRWGDPVARKRFFLRWGGCVVVAVLLAVVLWQRLGENAGISVAVPVVAITVFWPYVLWSQAKGIVQQLRKVPGLFDPGWITVSPEALFLGNVGGQARRDWQSVQELVVTGQHTLFFFGPQNLLAIPWRAFATPSEAQRFSELARQYWLSAKNAPPPSPPLEEIAAALGPERLEVRFRLEKPDLYAYFRHFMRGKSQLFILIGLGIVVGTMAGSVVGPIWTPVGALIGGAACPWIVIWISVRQAAAAPGVLVDQILFCSPQGIWVHTSGVGQGRIEWSAITEIEGTARFILFKRGPMHAIIVPRRVFASSAEADQFLAQVTRWRLPYATTPPEVRR
jgi:hypothetical protein